MGTVATSRFQLLQGDAATVLRTLPPASVHCAITSPPYFGQRSYGAGPDEIGIESCAADYVRRLVHTFAALKGVLREDGALWLNLGDKHADEPVDEWAVRRGDLLLLPFRVAAALQRDGWYLRQTIIWSKRNPSPTDYSDLIRRPTTAHEYVFLLSRRPAGYYYDWLAAALPNKDEADRLATDRLHGTTTPAFALERRVHNRRSVWTTLIARTRNPGHPAPFPTELISPMVLMGTSNAGVCPRCGSPAVRTIERRSAGHWTNKHRYQRPQKASPDAEDFGFNYAAQDFHRLQPDIDKGFLRSCNCDAADLVPAVVLDPFCGAGTTGAVALWYGRHFVGIDLAQAFLDITAKRLEAL